MVHYCDHCHEPLSVGPNGYWVGPDGKRACPASLMGTHVSQGLDRK